MKKAKAEILRKIHGGQICQIVATTAKLGIADKLKNGPKSLSELSKDLDIKEGVLHRLILALITMHLIEEDLDGKFSLTDEGQYLTSDHKDSVRALAIYKGSNPLWSALGCMYDGILQDQSPFELAYGRDLFQYLSEHQEEMKIFQDAMRHYEIKSSQKVLDIYPFEDVQTLVDIGGGTGSFLQTIIKKYPHITGIVFDLPAVIEYGKSFRQTDHLHFQSGSFFDQLPQGADCYLLRNILHDWCDNRCREILRNIHTHMNVNTKLLIFEKLIEKTGEKRLGKFADLTMFVLTPGGKERTLEEFQKLLTSCSFSLQNVYRTTGSKVILETQVV